MLVESTANYLFLAEIVEVVACQKGKFHIFGILVKFLLLYSRSLALSCFNGHENMSLLSVPYLVPFRISLQVSSILLCIAIMGPEPNKHLFT
jgi:hypothetical protein